MGCGSLLGDLFYLADSLLESPHTKIRSQNDYLGGNEGLHARLYQMYGQGQINEEVFGALRVLANRGTLRPADMAVHQVKSRSPQSTHKVDSEVQNALNGIHLRLKRLTDARANTVKVLQELDERLADLDKVVVTKEEKATRAVFENNEDLARQRLSEKADLINNHAQLDAQAQALREDLDRLDHLRIQLENKAAELKAVQTREEMANIDGI